MPTRTEDRHGDDAARAKAAHRIVAGAGAAILGGVFALLGTSALAAPGSRADTERWMIEQARAWADQACGGPWVISALFADDFRGTAPKGTRYDKPAQAPVFDASTQWSKDCRLDAAELRFFGDDVAVMYGAESKTVPLPNGANERRCLVWTDTWMRRAGRWQIIAAQDNRVDCPAP